MSKGEFVEGENFGVVEVNDNVTVKAQLMLVRDQLAGGRKSLRDNKYD